MGAKMEESVDESRGMATGKNKAVAVKPVWFIVEKTGPEKMSSGGKTKWGTGVAGVGFVNCVHGKGTNGVDC